RHARFHKTWFDTYDAKALRAVLVVETFKIVGESGLGGAVQDHRLAAAIPSHRTEHTQCSTAGEETRPRLLAEQYGIGEIDREQIAGAFQTSLERGLCREVSSGHHNGVNRRQCRRRSVHCRNEAVWSAQIAMSDADCGGGVRADLNVASRTLEISH